MPQSHSSPVPSGEPTWDVTFTRLTRAVRPLVAACARDLARRFEALGLGTDTTVMQTPRGLSTFLALAGQRGLICIIDLTLIDGVAVGQVRCAALDIRLLDASGDVVADDLAGDSLGRPFAEAQAAQALISEHLDRAATAVYVSALTHFGLLRQVGWHA